MKSAGEVTNQQPPMLKEITIGKVDSPQGGIGTPNISFKLGDDAWKDYQPLLKTQQKWNNCLQAAAMGANTILGSVGAALNFSIQSKYFDLQNTIAANQHDLGMRAMDLESKKLDVAREMNSEQISFQKSVARIQQQTQVTISRIQERGKTNRAEIFSAMNAFQRTNYYSGQPTFKLGAVS